MGQVFSVVTGPRSWKLARLKRDGIKYRGQILTPTRIALLQATPGSGSDVVAGAMVGGLLAGGVGAIVGGLASTKGRTAFTIDFANGDQLVCTISPKLFPGVVASVNEIIRRRSRPAKITVVQDFSWLWAIVFGPLYMARYGFLAFVFGVVVCFLTLGIAWPFLSLVSLYLTKQQRKERVGVSAN